VDKKQLDFYKQVVKIATENPALEIIQVVSVDSFCDDLDSGFAEIHKVEIGNWYEHFYQNGYDCVVYRDENEIMELITESIFNDYPDFSQARICALAERIYSENVKKVIYVRTAGLEK
jgi:hypothetical protein